MATDEVMVYAEAPEGKRDTDRTGNMASYVTETCLTTKESLVGVVVDVRAVTPSAPISPVVSPPAVVFPIMHRLVTMVSDTAPVERLMVPPISGVPLTLP